MAALMSTVISLVGMWFMFTKMGHEGWEGIIPIYNMYILFKELGYSGWMLLWLIVPIANIVMLWCLFVRLAKAFSMPKIFALGLLLLSSVFVCILGFNDANFNPEFIYQ